MSAKLKKPSKSTKKPATESEPILNKRGERIDRPFDPAILREAQTRAEHYQINVFTEDGMWYGRIVEMPNVMNHGRTPAAAIKAVREILTTTIAFLIEEGLPIDPPFTEARDRQINVRVSGYEKQALERAAKQQGFRGIGDFVRHAALSKT